MSTSEPRCPVCHRASQHTLAASWYVLRVCGGHLVAARSVTGIGLAPRSRDSGDVLFEMGGG